MIPIRKRPLVSFAALLALVSFAAASHAAEAANDLEARTVRSSNGAGIRVGLWDVQGIPTGSGATHTPAFEGYFQKGLDAHLVWENTLGYWGQNDRYTTSGLLGSSEITTHTHVIPSMTSLKIYPFTTRASQLEPFAVGGLGLALGIVQQQTTGAGGPSPSDGTNIVSGLGIRTGGGVDWHWTHEFGMTIGARYQWATFSQTVGSQAMYRGPGFDAGLTYRFQYQ